RGMMQLIRDLAPGASQAFHSAFNGQADFAGGIVELATVANCDIVCDDVFYYAEPFFQDGIIAQAVDNVVGMGVPYFSAAGNHGRKSYEDNFRPSGMSPVGYAGGDAHDFDPGPGVDIYQEIEIPTNRGVVWSFQWDEPFFAVSGPPGSANDMDFLIYDDPPTMILASSTDFNVGGDPVEVMGVFNGTAMNTFNIALVRNTGAGGPDPGVVKYIAFVNGALDNFVPNEWDTQSGTVYGHMNAQLCETMGAAFYFDTPEFGTSPPVREDFSSAGNTPILFDVAGNPVSIIRDNPNIVAVDGTNTTFFGLDIPDPGDGSDLDIFPNFYGTSAAAPHAAAVAALMLEENPGLGPGDVYAALENTAIDMDVPGFDTDTGFGLIQADAAVCAVDATPPVITSCPGDITVECSDFCGTPATDPQLSAFFAGFTATDLCDDNVDLSNNAPVCFPVGTTTTVTFGATDDSGNASTCTADVTVVDTTPPDITVTFNRYVLWPPNHKMVDITATVTVADVCCDAPTFVLTSITSNEPDNGRGDGNTVNDIQGHDLGTPDTSFQLRSERAGPGDGRIYTIVYTATDCVGNTTAVSEEIRVPHDHSGWAVGSTGFQAVGVGFDPALDQVALVVRSKAEEYGFDENGNEYLISDPFDATLIDVTQAYVGNTQGVALPEETMEIDNDGDGLTDLALFYSAAAINMILYASAPAGEDKVDRDHDYGPIGLHYTGPDGVDYLVPNIFNLGEPVPLVPSIDIGRGSGGADEPDDRFKDVPNVTALLPSYPNPFNPSTTIPFNLVTEERVTLRIYGAQGELVRTLRDEVFPAGLHRAVWDGRDTSGASVATGVYFVRLRAGAFQTTQKIVLIK
ncbi:MAG: S8 family serine peptidase, partial [Candidatus Latescibacterota bacterium]